MRSPLYIALVLAVLIVLAAALVRLAYVVWRRRPDEAWKPTGYTPRFTGYDQSKAPAARLRSELNRQHRRRLHAQRSKPQSGDAA